jgi:RNA polymerase sigma-B factor
MASATLTLHPRRPVNDETTVADNALSSLHELAKQDQERAKLRETAIQTYMPLASRLARSFHGRGEDLDDLMQVAMLGLIKAVDRFDPERGVAFSKFAVPTILGELKKHFRDSAWSLHVTRRMQELHLQISRAQPALTQELGRSPSVADIAKHLEISEAEVLAGMECGGAYNTRSLNSPVTVDDGAIELGQLIGAPDDRMESVPDRQALRQHVSELPAREQRILYLRFFEDLTQSQIAKKLGISQMHVSRLLSQSLGALRGRLLAEV